MKRVRETYVIDATTIRERLGLEWEPQTCPWCGDPAVPPGIECPNCEEREWGSLRAGLS